jgi:hypothetical protein
MVMVPVADLHELDPVTEMVNHCLVTTGVPPLNSDVILAARCDNPEWNWAARLFMDLRKPRPFLGRQMNVPFECGGFYRQAEPFVEELDEPMKTMVRRLVAAIDQWV